MDKAYKILGAQFNISNKKAKEMLDLGLVSVAGKKLNASELIAPSTKFSTQKMDEIKILFQDEQILAINKPNLVDISSLERKFSGWSLLNRIDKPTSGVVLLCKKNSNFSKKAIEEFRQMRVHKEYLALVNGIVAENLIINKPILTQKGHFAKSKIDFKHGLSAISEISPLKIINKKTLLKVIIKTGRTHQIRVHLASINLPILGDKIYGGTDFARLMLHSYKMKLFDYEFCASDGNFFRFLGE